MKRERVAPRTDWPARCESVGFHFHSLDGHYWDESACYSFSSAQIDALEAATNEVHAMCMQVVDHVVDQARFDEFALPEAYRSYVTESWRLREPHLLGRFDFCWDGVHAPRLLEYNADTPTSLVEASIAQWYWLQDVFPHHDQFNSLHEALLARWKEIRKQLPLSTAVHFSCTADNVEDQDNLDYLRDTAIQADIETQNIAIEDIGWDETSRRFVDLQNQPVTALFKLYPWEWMLRESFGPHLLAGRTRFIEPPWKMLLSNKALLVLLWELFPGHPNLLPTYRSPDALGNTYARKPLLSREGANIRLRSASDLTDTSGQYGEEGFVYQELCMLPKFDQRFAVVGAWVVGDAAHGMGIREDASPVTQNMSTFVPHYFVD